ncbi:MAG: cupin domain-containing protein [Candidatus Thorarchaeota archaeon]
MKKIHELDIVRKNIDGKVGSVDVYDVIDENIQAGVRIVKSNSDVPTRTHRHPERQLLYVIEGTAEITNGKETFSLNPGDFVLLESNEEHYVETGDSEAKLFEIKYP